MSAAKAIIAEDEPVLRAELRRSLSELWPDLEVCAEVADGVAALQAIERHAPDVLFLDIQMPGMSGLEVAQAVAGRCHIAFVTAYDAYAVAAFEQGAVDYVMKPFSTARLAKAVARLKAKLGSAPQSLDGILRTLAARLEQGGDALRWITASHGNELELITVDEVCYFRSDAKYTMVVTATADIPIRVPIKELIERLDPVKFWQIHRGTVVNVSAIAGVTRDFRGHLTVRLKQRKETLAVSESYVHLFKQM
ncbi:MAG: LytTR family DNA-binding domain-containing protein [Burkholderiaceae bacterium]